jgi:hypothetical protein
MGVRKLIIFTYMKGTVYVNKFIGQYYIKEV